MAYQGTLQSILQDKKPFTYEHLSPVKRRSIKLRAMEIDGEMKTPIIHLVDSSEKFSEASALINRRYVLKGYGDNHRIPSSENHMTFTAEASQEVIGTITLAVDSENGMAAERTFSPEIQELRAVLGAKLCELTKFAFSSTINSKQLMAELFHIVFVYGYRTHRCTDLVIEVHPRHVRFYQAMLGFKKISPVRINVSVGAPLQLMHLKVSEIRENINRFAGQQEAAPHSLYPMFFSPVEENGIYDRLRSKTNPAYNFRRDKRDRRRVA